MQKRFVLSIFVSVALNLLIKPFSVLVIDAGVQRSIGNVEYGKYFALLSLTLITNVLLDLGINNYTVRNIAQDEKRISYHINNILLFRFVLFLLYALAVITCAYVFDLLESNLTVLILLILNQFLVQNIALIRSFFSGQHRFILDSFVSVLDRALLILIIGVTFIQLPDWITIQYFVFIQFVCYAVTLIFAFICFRGVIHWSRVSWNWTYVRTILTESVPYATLVLFMLIYNRADTLLIRLLANKGAYEAGIYAQGFRLYDALYMVGIIFASVLFPMFSRMLHQKDTQINDLIEMSSKWLIGGVLALVFVVVENADLILSSLYKNQVTQDSSFVFIGLMFAFLSMSFNFIFGTLLTANGDLKILNRISIAGAILSVALNIIVIPIFGAKGAVVIAIITQSSVSCSLLYFSHKKIKFKTSLTTWFSLLIYACFLCCLHPLLNMFPRLLTPILSPLLAIFGAFWFSLLEIKTIYSSLFKETNLQ